MKKKLKYIIMTGVLAVSMLMGCGKEEDKNVILGQYKGMTLYEGGECVISREEIQCITPEYSDICRMVEILERNQVFPVHLKEIVCELIELRLEQQELPISA